MTKKIYLETFKKCPRSVCFPLLISTWLRKSDESRRTTRARGLGNINMFGSALCLSCQQSML